jgi:hypothetical protein
LETAQRTCRICHQTKSLDEFGPSTKHKDGKETICHVCQLERRAAWRAKNREKLRLASAAYFASHKEEHRRTVNAYDANHREERRVYWHDHKEEMNLKRSTAYAEDPTKILERNKQWRDENPEHIQNYRLEHAEERREQWKQWYATHQPQILFYRQTHRAETSTRVSAWAKANPEREAANEQRRRARKKALPDTWTVEQQTFMLEYWHYSCAVCGNAQGLFWCLAHDHWIPLASPDCPGTIATNMIPLCHGDGGCNNRKNDSDPHTWLFKRFTAKKAAKIEQAIETYFNEVKVIFLLP